MAAAKSAWSTVVRKPEQPDLSPFHVYQRTDGKYIVTDDRLPLGKKTIAIRARLEPALDHAKELYDAEACSSKPR